MKKKISIIILALSLVIACAFAGCSNEDIRDTSGDEANRRLVESMTDEQLIGLACEGYDFTAIDLYSPDDFGVPLEEKDMWHQLQLNSVSDTTEAYAEIVSFALMQNPKSYTIDYIGENEYYYQYKLTYISSNFSYGYTYRIIVYKDSAKICSFSSQKGYTLKIRKPNLTSVTDLLDLEIFFMCDRWLSANIVYRNLTEKAGTYIYTYYLSYISYGDSWGNVSNVAHLEKNTINVDKMTGLITASPTETLKTVIMPKTI